MKRFLLSSLLLLVMGRTAFCYVNGGNVFMPPNLELANINEPVFVNNGTFSVNMAAIQFSATALYTTSSTLYYTNNGNLVAVPGIDFENFPASAGQAQMSAVFANNSKGLSSGSITVSNAFAFEFPDFNNVGLATIRVRATNVIDSGLMAMGDTGLIDIFGQDVNLQRGRFIMSLDPKIDLRRTFFFGLFGLGGQQANVNILDSQYSRSNIFNWTPSIQLTPVSASSPEFITQNSVFSQMFLNNAEVYFESLAPQPDAVNTNLIIWRGLYIMDNSAQSVVHNVFFGPEQPFGGSEFNVEWEGTYRNATNGQIFTNFFYLTDDPAIRDTTNNFAFPVDFNFVESTTRLIPDTTIFAPQQYANPAPLNSSLSNNYSYLSLQPIGSTVATNVIFGGSITNLPGRVQLASSGSLNLADVRVLGANYVKLDAPVNFLGNSNAVITAPYSDLNLGVTNGSLAISNLLVSGLVSWSGVVGAPSAVIANGAGLAEMGGLQVWSGSYFFTDDNGFTNEVRIVMINSALQPLTSALQQNVFFHGATNLVISDELSIFGKFGTDAIRLTIATNDTSAFAASGQLNLLAPEIFWSASFTNLQYLTNNGRISAKNQIIFAGNVFSPSSDLSQATPYQAFVNHGTISSQGVFIRANYFENSGIIEEDLNNGIDIGVGGTMSVTNSQLVAPLGPITLAASSLLVSNSLINAGQSLILNASCSLSDGYVFGNQFGHITNATLPNVVTNGNFVSVGGGVRILTKPPTADLLGTTITNISLDSEDSISQWLGEDRGCSPAGYATNLALGRMILTSDGNPSQFTFQGINGSNALYVDSLEFQGGVTNTDGGGNFSSIRILPGMKIYYAQAMMNGVSIAEKLNGKNGGGFCWVSNYAGVYSSTNIPYPDGNTYIFNAALAISPDIASGGPDGSSTVVNVNNPTPIPTNELFDIVNIGPMPCDSGGTPPGPDPTNSPSQRLPSFLPFPPKESDLQTNGEIVPISFADAVGAYNGLFYETNGVNPATSGSFTAKVTAKGGFSAKLAVGGKAYSFSKTFDGAGSFSNSVTGKKLPTLTVVLQLVNNDEIEGTVAGDGWSAELLAYRAAFTSKNPAPAAWIGKDTALLTTDSTNSTMPAAGDAFGSATVSKAGAVQWSGVLPDSTKISQKSALSAAGVWPLYSSLYSNTGTLIGWLALTNGDVDLSGHAVWLAPAGKSGLNANGITNDLMVTGSSVTGSAGSLVSSTMILSGSSLASSLTNGVTISGKKSQSDNPTMKLSINLKTGLYNGTVTDPNSSQKLSFQGALLEKSGMGGGFFLNSDKNQGGKVSLAPAN